MKRRVEVQLSQPLFLLRAKKRAVERIKKEHPGCLFVIAEVESTETHWKIVIEVTPYAELRGY
jgi:hypothetical protein